MRIFKRLLIVLVVLIAVLAVIVATQPSEFRVSRSSTFAAAPSAAFDQVNDFHKWEAWSPWAKLDPNAKNSFEGPASGKGAIFKWSGNNDVGEGQMTIVDSQPNERIKIKLDFIKPFESTSDTEFTFKPEGDTTVVTWTMSGRNNFIGKAFCLIMDMDKEIGGKFDQGLAKMKSIVETK